LRLALKWQLKLKSRLFCQLNRHMTTLAMASTRYSACARCYFLKHLNNFRCLLLIQYTRVGTLIVATIYLQLIQNRYMFRSFTVLQFSHQHCVQPVASDVEVVGYL